MMGSVLLKLLAPGEPLHLFLKEMAPSHWSDALTFQDMAVELVASFLAHEFKDEKALNQVTRDSIDHFARGVAQQYLWPDLDPNCTLIMLNFPARVVASTVQAISALQKTSPPQQVFPGGARASEGD